MCCEQLLTPTKEFSNLPNYDAVHDDEKEGRDQVGHNGYVNLCVVTGRLGIFVRKDCAHRRPVRA